MIEQDYILRMLQEFFDAIGKMVRHRDNEDGDGNTAERQQRFDEVYEQFFKQSAAHFYQTAKEDILEDLLDEGRNEKEMFAKMQMIAELMYRDGLIKTKVPDKCNLLEKSLYIFEYIEHNSRTYSWEREQKMSEIRKLLTETKL